MQDIFMLQKPFVFGAGLANAISGCVWAGGCTCCGVHVVRLSRLERGYSTLARSSLLSE